MSYKKRGLTGSQFLEGVAGKEWATFLRKSFYIKNKLKSKYLTKIISKNVFSVITNNLNFDILIKTLVTFKRWDGVKYKKHWYYEKIWKTCFLGEGRSQKNNILGELPKKAGLGSLQI